MTPYDIALVRRQFDALAADPERFAARFEERLVALDAETAGKLPVLRTAFDQPLMSFMARIVEGLDRFEAIAPQMRRTARLWTRFGIEPDDYAVIGAALMGVLAGELGASFDRRAEDAWLAAYAEVAQVMIEMAERELEREAA
jgi:hypothetical protein